MVPFLLFFARASPTVWVSIGVCCVPLSTSILMFWVCCYYRERYFLRQVLCLHWSGEIWVKCSSTQTKPCFEVKWFLFGLQKLLWWSLLLHTIIIELSSWPSAGFLLPRSMLLIGITGKVSRSKQMALTQLKLLHGKHAWSFNANPSMSLRACRPNNNCPTVACWIICR